MAEEGKRLTVPDLKARKKATEKVVTVSIPDLAVLLLAGACEIALALSGGAGSHLGVEILPTMSIPA
jgi:hypothetical protein